MKSEDCCESEPIAKELQKKEDKVYRYDIDRLNRRMEYLEKEMIKATCVYTTLANLNGLDLKSYGDVIFLVPKDK